LEFDDQQSHCDSIQILDSNLNSVISSKNYAGTGTGKISPTKRENQSTIGMTGFGSENIGKPILTNEPRILSSKQKLSPNDKVTLKFNTSYLS
jgi:hypothetical protein